MSDPRAGKHCMPPFTLDRAKLQHDSPMIEKEARLTQTGNSTLANFSIASVMPTLPQPYRRACRKAGSGTDPLAKLSRVFMDDGRYVVSFNTEAAVIGKGDAADEAHRADVFGGWCHDHGCRLRSTPAAGRRRQPACAARFDRLPDSGVFEQSSLSENPVQPGAAL